MEKIFFYTKEPAAFNFHSLLFKRELEKTLKTHTHTHKLTYPTLKKAYSFLKVNCYYGRKT